MTSLLLFSLSALLVFVSPAADAGSVTSHCDVNNYCANGGDSIDDTLAINAALAAESAVFFPAGTYIYNGRMDVPNKTIRIYGEGHDVSRIRFNGGNGGIYFATGVETFELTDLCLLAGSGAAGTAVECRFLPTPQPATEKTRMATIARVEIAGTHARRPTLSTKYWERAPLLD